MIVIPDMTFGDVQRPARWQIHVYDPDGPQVYVGEGLDNLTERLRDFDPADVTRVYISD